MVACLWVQNTTTLNTFHVFCNQQKPKIGYKDLMKGYHNKVNTLAGSKSKTEVSLVINLFQSVLDGFIRGELKRAESEPAKVNFQWSVMICSFSKYKIRSSFLNSGSIQATKTIKKRKKKDKCVSWISRPLLKCLHSHMASHCLHMFSTAH